jgi:hypothetical protein
MGPDGAEETIVSYNLPSELDGVTEIILATCGDPLPKNLKDTVVIYPCTLK